MGNNNNRQQRAQPPNATLTQRAAPAGGGAAGGVGVAPAPGQLLLPQDRGHHYHHNFGLGDPLRIALEQSMAEASLPLGWDEATTGKGVTYFIDHINQTTTLQDPRLPANRQKRRKNVKVKLPKYKRDLYAKIQTFLYKIHQVQNDQGQLDLRISRDKLFDDSFAFITCLDPLTLTRRLFVKFEGEDGLDYGGMSREWFLSLSEEFLKPERCLFKRTSSGHHYMINRYSCKNPNHLEHFHFVGMIMGMAVYHGKMFEAYFSVPFYKLLLGRPLSLSDLQYLDVELHKNMKKLQEADDVDSWDLDFTIMDKDADGNDVVIPLMDGGDATAVTNENKEQYINLVLKYYFNSTDKQMEQIKNGLFQFVPLDYLQEFEPEEIEQLLGGNREIDVADLKANTEYGEGYTDSHQVIKLFWEVMGSLNQEELTRFLQFITGSTKVPVGGFAHLYGSNGPQKFLIQPKKTSGLPTAHSCFNRLELPTFADKDKLKKDLLYAINETCGFGLE